MGVDSNIISSELNTKLEIIKVYTDITLTYTPGTQVAEVAINHNLGYIPLVIAYLDSGGAVFQQLNFPVAETTGLLLEYWYCRADLTTFYVTMVVPTNSVVYADPEGRVNTFRVYLLRERSD